MFEHTEQDADKLVRDSTPAKTSLYSSALWGGSGVEIVVGARYKARLENSLGPAAVSQPLDPGFYFYCWIPVSARLGGLLTWEGVGNCEISQPPPSASINATAPVICST
jgi:hypothetical protein